MVAITATDVELQKPINAIFQQTLLRNAKARCPYFTGTQPGTLAMNGGTATIKWRRINTTADPGGTGIGPSTTALAELTGNSAYMQGRTAAQAAFTDIVATVSKYGQYYILNEEVDMFNFSGQTNKLMETLGIVAGRSLNQLQRDVGEDNATEYFAGGVASEALTVTAIATGDLDNVILTLNVNSALTFTPMTQGSQNIGTSPILPAYWGICHPHVAADIANLSGFTSVEKYSGQVETAPFEFGTYSLAGQAVRFMQTEDASISADAGGASAASIRGGADTDTYSVLIYGMDAVGTVGLSQQQTVAPYMAGDALPVIEFITNERGSGGVADPFHEVSTMAYKFWHTGAMLNTNWARSLVTGSVAR